ncbi:Cytochrome b559 subunit alpha, partial [Clarias magur]
TSWGIVIPPAPNKLQVQTPHHIRERNQGGLRNEPPFGEQLCSLRFWLSLVTPLYP